MRFNQYVFLIIYFIFGATSGIKAQKVDPSCARVVLRSDTIVLNKNIIFGWKKFDIPILIYADNDSLDKSPRLASFGFRLYKGGEYIDREFVKGKKINNQGESFWKVIGGSKIQVMSKDLYVLSVFRKKKFDASFAEHETIYRLQTGFYEFKIRFLCEGSLIERSGVLIVK